MSIVITIWWLAFWTAFGLCIGSFLNVIIYRLPRNQSLHNPRWSHCPACGHRIRWYDNLPVLSFALLLGRCRDCRSVISLRYPIVEMLTALVVLVIFDAFFVARVRQGLLSEPGLTWGLAQDWPVFLAHLVLFACLLAMAAIDLKEYWVDIRFTTVATWFGLILHTVWTPAHSLAGPSRTGWPRPGDATALGCLAATGGLGLVWLWLRRRPAPAAVADAADAILDAPAAATVEAAGAEAPPVSQRPASTDQRSEVAEADPGVTAGATDAEDVADTPDLPGPSTHSAAALFGAALVAAILLATFLWLCWDAADHGQRPVGSTAVAVRAAVPILLVLVLVLVEAAVPRETDTEIIEAIEAERFSARRTALAELGVLVPAIVLGAGAVWLQLSDGPLGRQLSDLLHFQASGTWQPLYGLSTALAGYVIGGGIGWAVRIVFTLLFGKEAFGLGDIHIMAAAGCVAGWPVVLLAFFVTIFVALAAWILTLPFKRTRAIPLVPWLALGYLVVVVYYETLLKFGPIRNTIELSGLLINRISQPAGGGGL